MEFKGVTLEEGMILTGLEIVAPLKKGAEPKDREAYKVIRIFEPELVTREVFGGYDHTVEREEGVPPHRTGTERRMTKVELKISFDEFRFGSEPERHAFAQICNHYQMTHKDFDKWAKGKKLELHVDEYGQPALDNRDLKAEYVESRRRRGQ